MELKDIIICVAFILVFIYAETYKRKFNELSKAFRYLVRKIYPNSPTESIAIKIINDMKGDK